MRIQRIYANNFKSLINFDIELSKFACLIGLNGAGKSTVLQLIDFIGQQVRGDIKGWLSERHWKASDINSRLLPKRTIEFEVDLVNSDGKGGVSWKGTFNTTMHHCTYEKIVTSGGILEVEKGRLRITDLTAKPNKQEWMNEKISFSYEGSVLSQLLKDSLPISLYGFKNYFSSINSLDLLSPEHLRQRTREADGSIGLGGQKLSAFLHELGPRKQSDLARRLKKIYPHLESLYTRSLRSGWKQLEISENYKTPKRGFFPHMITEARHVNDGMLRLIAILAELESNHRFLLFDEIENGMNPELIEFVLNELVTTQKQIVVTTHSPMILNYLDDEIAKEGVIYLYKNKKGHTHSIPFFSIPSLAKKLTVMGPGEAFVDTNLTDLSKEIKTMPKGQ